MKPCTKCGKPQALSAFRIKANGVRDSWCTPCNRASCKERRERVRAAELAGPYPWQPDPLNSVFVNWLQVRL
jgi:hypothetical protein